MLTGKADRPESAPLCFFSLVPMLSHRFTLLLFCLQPVISFSSFVSPVKKVNQNLGARPLWISSAGAQAEYGSPCMELL